MQTPLPSRALQRNRAKICTFFVRGECKRGAECPYRHEMPTSGALVGCIQGAAVSAGLPLLCVRPCCPGGSCPAWFVGGALLSLKPAQFVLSLKPAQFVLSLKPAQCPHVSHKAWPAFPALQAR